LGGRVGRVDDLSGEVAAKEFAVSLAKFRGFKIRDRKRFKFYESFLSKRKGFEMVIFEVGERVGADLIKKGFKSIVIKEVVELGEELVELGWLSDEVTENKGILINYFVAEESLVVRGEEDRFVGIKF